VYGWLENIWFIVAEYPKFVSDFVYKSMFGGNFVL